MKLQSRDLSFLRSVHDEHLQDSCKIMRYQTVTKSARNASLETWLTDTAETPCGLEFKSRRYITPDMTVISIDGTIRLPIGTTITAKDRILVTKRYGSNVSNVVYELDGEPVTGSAGKTAGLIRVKGSA